MRSPDAQSLLDRARAGDARAWSQLLEGCRPYLRVMAARQVGGALRARVDPSDVVQLTFLEAHQGRAKFRGAATAELMGWLRAVLANNVATLVERHVVAQRRSVEAERAFAGGAESSAAAPPGACEVSSPSQRAMRGESALALAEAILRLPADQAEAVRLRHLEGWTLAQMATELGRSEVAVASLIKRGLQGLREDLGRGASPQ